MAIEDFGTSIIQFEEILQKITANMTSGVIFEKLMPPDLWKRSEADVTSLQNSALHLRELMLVFKPEKTPTIERRTRALVQPLGSFKEILSRKSDDPLTNSKLALEELRKAVVEGSNLLDLAKEIKRQPSEGISAVLKLKEVYDAKEYLSAIPVPGAIYARFLGLRKNIENLQTSLSNLEQVLRDLRKNLDSVVDEMSKFRPMPTEELEEKPVELEVSTAEEKGPEPSLVSENK